MKDFIKICKMTQPELKAHMQEYLTANKYDVVNGDGFLYAKGDVPVLLVAHMDTVHVKQCKAIYKKDGKLTSPEGIGGDDRCGVFIIKNIVKELHCSVLLCEDEEKGGIGAKKFTNATYEVDDGTGNIIKSKYIDHLDVNYMIEFDRKGNNDAVFYSCGNQAFIDFIEDETNFKFAYGSFSDISTLMPAAKLSGVNLSSGYYNAHSVDEYVVYEEMIDTADAAKALIKAECEKPFEYIPKSYPSYYGGSYRSGRYDSAGNSYYGSMYGGSYGGYNGWPNYGSYNNVKEPEYSDDRLASNALTDTDLELEVIIYNVDLQEETLTATGETKAECWMTLFLENPNLCFNDIVDYSWG